MPKGLPAGSLIAFQITGDLAGVTYVQKTQRRRVAYAKTYPKKTPSHLQEIRRKRFAEANAKYRQQSKSNKETLDKIVLKLNAVMSGYNIFMSCILTNHPEWIQQWAKDYNLPWEII